MSKRIWIWSLALAAAAALTAGTVVNYQALVALRSTLDPFVWQNLGELGASPGEVAARNLIGEAVPVLGCVAAGWILAVARPRNAVGWLFLAAGLMLSGAHLVFEMSWLREATTAAPATDWAYVLFFGAALSVPAVVLVLYPDERLPARWWRWPIGVAIGGIALERAFGWYPHVVQYPIYTSVLARLGSFAATAPRSALHRPDRPGLQYLPARRFCRRPAAAPPIAARRRGRGRRAGIRRGGRPAAAGRRASLLRRPPQSVAGAGRAE